MADAAQKFMSIEEFFAWAEQQEEPYELDDGVPRPLWPHDPLAPQGMAGPSGDHQQVMINVRDVIQARLKPPCWVLTSFSVEVSPSRTRLPDVVMSCTPRERGAYVAPNPLLIVEVLSPSTEDFDRGRKLDLYKALPTVCEIWLVASDRLWAQVWWRENDDWLGRDFIGPGRFASAVLSAEIALDQLFEGVAV